MAQINRPKTCFVIGPIGEEGTNSRREADSLIENVLDEPLRSAGFDVVQRADQLPNSGSITLDIIRHLKSDDLVITDLRSDNPNVYYELAVRHVMRNAVIGFRSPNQALPFDIKDMRVIEVDAKNASSTRKARDSLTLYLENLPPPGKAESPLGVALDWISMDSKGAEERTISHIDQQVSRILSLSELAVMDKNTIIYSTAITMWRVAESVLEQVVMELQNTEGDCARYCLERVRKIEEALLKFKDTPYINQNL